MIISHEELKELFSYDDGTGILKRKTSPCCKVKIGDEAGTLNSNGYRQVQISGKLYQSHIIIWCLVYGYFPEDEIDHINRCKHDNRLCNLRVVSKVCNLRNRGINKNNTSGIKGVSFDKSRDKWQVHISVGKRLHNLGRYIDIYEAVCARFAAEQCLNWAGCDSNSPAFRYVKENIQCH